jgi:hypothetical protein
MNLDRLRWCPVCGRVEIDDPGVYPRVIRRGDDRCSTPAGEWKRGSAEDCDLYFGDRFEKIRLPRGAP